MMFIYLVSGTSSPLLFGNLITVSLSLAHRFLLPSFCIDSPLSPSTPYFKKMMTLLFLNNLVKNEPILMSFGTQNPDDIRYRRP